MDLVERIVGLAMENVERGGRPFSCVVARSEDGRVVAESPNLVWQTNDPTAHAEVVAIRQACQRLGCPSLEGYEVYVLANPCPMCLGAPYYASLDRVLFVVTREEEGRHYRDDQRYFEFENFYEEYAKPWHRTLQSSTAHSPCSEAGTHRRSQPGARGHDDGQLRGRLRCTRRERRTLEEAHPCPGFATL